MSPARWVAAAVLAAAGAAVLAGCRVRGTRSPEPVTHRVGAIAESMRAEVHDLTYYRLQSRLGLAVPPPTTLPFGGPLA